MPAPAPPPDLTGLSLAEIARLAEAKALPPVASWNPAHCGHSGMRIARDGTWFHEGAPIARPAMVRLFSSILRREEDGRFVLVTPVEKLDIEVEDAPFVAVEMKSEGAGAARSIGFRLNDGGLVIAGPDHPIRMEQRPEGARPYVAVRDGLDAAIARQPFYELAEIALAEAGDPPGVHSGGMFFPLGGPE